MSPTYVVDAAPCVSYGRVPRRASANQRRQELTVPSTRFVGWGLAVLGAAVAALIPVFLVIYPSVGIGQAQLRHPEQVLPILAANPALVIGPGLLQMLGHAAGAAAILGLWLRSGGRSFLLSVATLGGLVWTSVDLLDNALTMQLMPALAVRYMSGYLSAAPAYLNASDLIDSVRLAGHFGAGI